MDEVRTESRQFSKETFAVFAAKNNDWSGVVAAEMERNLNCREGRDVISGTL